MTASSKMQAYRTNRDHLWGTEHPPPISNFAPGSLLKRKLCFCLSHHFKCMGAAPPKTGALTNKVGIAK